MALAVAIVTHDSLGDLAHLFEGQLSTTERLGAAVIVVDNASGDGTVEFLRERQRHHAGLTVVEMGRNAGYAAAVNAAFMAASDRDVLLINPDVEVCDERPILALAELLEGEPSVGVVGPRLVGGDGGVQPSARRFPSIFALIGSLPAAHALRPLRRGYERYLAPSSAGAPVTVDWVIGAAMLIRRAAYDDVGGWDERFFLYMEDADFCRRCARAGWEVAYLPSAVMRHRYPRASSRRRSSVLSSPARRHHIAGLARLFARDPRLLVGLGGGRPRSLEPWRPR